MSPYLVLFLILLFYHNLSHTIGKIRIQKQEGEKNSWIIAKSPKNYHHTSSSPFPISSNPFFDSKGTKPTISNFFNRKSRLGFLRKVYSIFSIQCLFTIALLLFTQQHKSFQIFLRNSAPTIHFLSWMICYGVIDVLSFFQTLRQTYPYNLLLLGFFTFAFSLEICMFSFFFHSPLVILMSLFYTILSFTGITVYSYQKNPQYDLSWLGKVLFMTLFMIGIGFKMNRWIFQAPFLQNLLCIGAAIVYSGYIAYDTELILSGRKTITSVNSLGMFPTRKKKKSRIGRRGTGRGRGRKLGKLRKGRKVGDIHEVVIYNDPVNRVQKVKKRSSQPIYYNSKDYVYAAMSLYIDVMGLFINLIQILTAVEENDEKKKEK